MDGTKLMKMAFDLMQDMGIDNVEERHLNQNWNFEKMSEGKYKFSMYRHPSFGPCQDRRNGLVAFVEVENNYILDTTKMDIECIGKKFIRAEIDYGQMAQLEAKKTADIFSSDIEEIKTRKKAIEFAQNEAERLDWITGLADEISDLETEFPEFSFDWDLYLTTVKKHFIDKLIKDWEDSDHLKLVEN